MLFTKNLICSSRFIERRLFSNLKEQSLEIPGQETIPFGNELPYHSDFEKFKDEKFIYVDKTDIIYDKLIKKGGFYFMARPRRFGKSLLLSTLAAIGSKDESLKSLKIGKYMNEMKTHPIVYFDFSNKVEMSLKEYIFKRLKYYARKLKLEVEPFYDLQEILEAYCKIGPEPFLLVDEYDYPLWLGNKKNSQMDLMTLREFFTACKANRKYMKFNFVTGIIKVQDSGTSSGFNYLNDITMREDYATLLGFTEEEIKKYFPTHIQDLSNKLGCTETEIIERLRDHYNGYNFSSNTKKSVYNPISLVEAFRSKEIKNWWIETSKGNIGMLKQIYKKADFKNIAQKEFHFFNLPIYNYIEVKNPNLISVMWQTGYLTIKSYFNEKVYFKIPNKEVEEFYPSIQRQLLLNQSDDLAIASVNSFVGSLIEGDVKEFCIKFWECYETLTESFKTEREFELFMTTILQLSSYENVKVERQYRTGSGIADIVFKFYELLVIIELKLDQTAKYGLEQIIKNDYFIKIHINFKKIILIGLNYSKEAKNLNEAEYIEIDKEKGAKLSGGLKLQKSQNSTEPKVTIKEPVPIEFPL